MNKVDFLKEHYDIEQHNVIGVLTDAEKMIYLGSVLQSYQYTGLYYFDDSIAFLSELRDHFIITHDADILNNIMLFHASSIINRSFNELVTSGNIIDEYM